MLFEVDRSCAGSVPEYDFVSGAPTGRFVRGVSDLGALLRLAASYDLIRILSARRAGWYRLELVGRPREADDVDTSTTFDSVGPVPGWHWERFTTGVSENRMARERTIVVVRDLQELCRIVDDMRYVDVIYQPEGRHPFCLRSLP